MEEQEIFVVREAVRAGFASLDRGECAEYEADTIENLAAEVKARAGKLLEARQSLEKRG